MALIILIKWFMADLGSQCIYIIVIVLLPAVLDVSDLSQLALKLRFDSVSLSCY